MENIQITELLHTLASSDEAGLIVVSAASHAALLDAITAAGYHTTDDYDEAVNNLEQGRSVAVMLSHSSPFGVYEMLRQYTHRRGIVQVVDPIDGSLRLLQLDPAVTKLVGIISSGDEARVLERFPGLMDTVGIVLRSH